MRDSEVRDKATATEFFGTVPGALALVLSWNKAEIRRFSEVVGSLDPAAHSARIRSWSWSRLSDSRSAFTRPDTARDSKRRPEEVAQIVRDWLESCARP